MAVLLRWLNALALSEEEGTSQGQDDHFASTAETRLSVLRDMRVLSNSKYMDKGKWRAATDSRGVKDEALCIR